MTQYHRKAGICIIIPTEKGLSLSIKGLVKLLSGRASEILGLLVKQLPQSLCLELHIQLNAAI